MNVKFRQGRFPLGHLVATPGAIDAMERATASPLVLLARHVTGDWGDLCDEDKAANERAVSAALRLLSAYNLSDDTEVWIITEADRSSTIILLPEEY